jgi:hypothetical protein
MQGVNWMQVVQDRVQWHAVASIVIKPSVPIKYMAFLHD